MLGEADEDDAFPVGPSMMWLIYAGCVTCGAGPKGPCVGERFGPHPGRQTRWEQDAGAFEALAVRVRAEMAAGAARAVAAGYVPPPEAHGQRGAVKWLVRDDAGEVLGWEGGRLCHCGSLFVRTLTQGGMPMTDRDLQRHVADRAGG